MRYEFLLDLKSVRPGPRPSSERTRPRVPPMRRTLVLAYQIRDYMIANRLPTLSAFCECAHITRARASQIMNLLHLSPRIQEKI